MTYKVFVDGQDGTTGLKIYDYLSRLSDIEVLQIPPEQRKDPETRRLLLNAADVVFLCLPDEAARESVSLIENPRTQIINASTAFRTDPAWAYGLPELKPAQREAIRESSRVSVPGCHATGFILSLHPLVAAGIVPRDYPVACFSITGYSGGGKKLIALYEAPRVPGSPLHIPRHYALTQAHKHTPEMQMYAGLDYAPQFTPVVSDFYQGLAMSLPLAPRWLHKPVQAREVHELLAAYYAHEPFVKVMPYQAEAELDQGHFNLGPVRIRTPSSCLCSVRESISSC
ncbi:N-acetyl-gamma-glutamyl-phosphate reductase [Paenibacillus sp. TAB 01]|uniref:N-acetyl-gamma-glutamyl-phosphate reductase n=1 Tax=Paenibacillus sp. TAB 01 TaxID=3368988 RepID=UPI00375376B0